MATQMDQFTCGVMENLFTLMAMSFSLQAKDAYLAAMKKIARLLGGTNNVDKLMEDVLDFETSLINVNLVLCIIFPIQQCFSSICILPHLDMYT